MSHECHAHECTKNVSPKMFMCKSHWYKLPPNLRDAIWREYWPDQEKTKLPSNRYMTIQQWSIMTVAFRPNNEAAALVCAEYMERALRFRQCAIDEGAGDPLEGLIND